MTFEIHRVARAVDVPSQGYVAKTAKTNDLNHESLAGNLERALPNEHFNNITPVFSRPQG